MKELALTAIVNAQDIQLQCDALLAESNDWDDTDWELRNEHIEDLSSYVSNAEDQMELALSLIEELIENGKI